ncbi:MAG: hypothetical protein ACRC46_02920 [Thermoguttaceae bacterium]
MTSTDKIVETLKRMKIELEPGLTDGEVRAVEERFLFRFPPDLRQLLQMALPVSERFYHWRSALADAKIAEQIEKMFDWPRDGILFDVEHNNFWIRHDVPGILAWEPKPTTLEKQLETASQHLSSYVKLIPIYSHRYIPAEPFEEGNPVFSVYQADIICYGDSLENYFRNEFWHSRSRRKLSKNIKHIPFWSDCSFGTFEKGTG